ncbi:uncharacterized protein LOC132058125 isoform X1 [Lycium ferocissimum]|uniref:uncharacterized protein LOC132058125 isoform X1 n=1 Tax=Lycium ferocissimum TaxID=112874 RepID=UPI002815B2A6|nr:uncharacterized protein LOC132058125 isoform X1 [Lycium ferocissimum]
MKYDEAERVIGTVMDGSSKGKGTQNQGSTRSQLYEICAVNHWKAPLFECCSEEGPDHHKLFTFKVIVEIRGPRTTTIECMGNPHPKKKVAAENAAEGALWFLNQAGYRFVLDQMTFVRHLCSSKSHLYDICAVNHWKAPLFECCSEEGPDHHKLFTFKVIVEIRGLHTTTIECMGNPHSEKKVAAENAAEGALWFLNQAGYRLKY